MRLVSRIVVVAVVFIALFAGACWGMYVIRQPISLPYLDNGTSWSSFYTRFYMGGVPLDLERFKKQEPWLTASLNSMSKADKQSMADLSYSYLQQMTRAKVVLDIAGGGDRALIVSGDIKGEFACVILRYQSTSAGRYEFVNRSDSVVHAVAGAIASQCNEKEYFSVQRTSFYDFLFYDIARCFSFCSTKDGIVFRGSISGKKEKRVLANVRAKLASAEKEVQSVERDLHEIDVSVTSVVASDEECFVAFVYVSPDLRRVPIFAHVDCDSEEIIDLNQVGFGTSLAYYFFTLWPSS